MNGNVPLGHIAHQGAWSLASLLFGVVGIIISLLLALGFLLGRKNEDDEWDAQQDEELARRRKTVMALKVAAIALGVIVMAVWLILEDFSLPMIWINQWTLVILVLLLVQLIVFAVYKAKAYKLKSETQKDLPLEVPAS